MRGTELLIIYFLIGFCLCDHCSPQEWTPELCQDCFDLPNVKADKSGCTKVDCNTVKLWSNLQCSECYSTKIYSNTLRTECTETNCGKIDVFTNESCLTCFGQNYYPTFGGKNCSQINCETQNKPGLLTQDVCISCTKNTPYVNLDQSKCLDFSCPKNTITEDVCKNCYSKPLYLMFNYVGCTDIDCNNIDNFNDERCTKCLGKSAYATGDHQSCKPLKSILNFRGSQE